MSYPTSASGIICFIKNHQQRLLDFADFAWLEQPEGNLMDAISWVWYNGSYTIAAKPIKTLELHHTMIQFLINQNIYVGYVQQLHHPSTQSHIPMFWAVLQMFW